LRKVDPIPHGERQGERETDFSDERWQEKSMRLKDYIGLWLLALVTSALLVRPGGAVETAEDLAAVIALRGKPCGKVVNAKKLGDNDYRARCATGDVYRVRVDKRGRVTVTKQ
jgi:hypothetical protein